MYNGGIFGGVPTGPLGVGVFSGWGNVPDTQAKVEPKLSDQSIKTRNKFLGWFPKANKEKFVFSKDHVSWHSTKIFLSGMPKNTSMNNDLGISPSFPP